MCCDEAVSQIAHLARSPPGRHVSSARGTHVSSLRHALVSLICDRCERAGGQSPGDKGRLSCCSSGLVSEVPRRAVMLDGAGTAPSAGEGSVTQCGTVVW